MKRSLDIVILSGIHLGHKNSKVDSLKQYLDAIQPKEVIINGNFIDSAQCSEAEIEIIKTLTAMAEEGTKIHFIANNERLALQVHSEFYHRNISFENHLTLSLNGKKYLFLNDNFVKENFGLRSTDIPKEEFGNKAIEKAIEESCDYIVCGHQCMPKMKLVPAPENHRLLYMHPGDWQDHTSALEYNWGCWTLYEYDEEHYQTFGQYEDNVWGASAVEVEQDTFMMTYY